MKNAVAVLNVGGKSLHHKSRASLTAAAHRWGCDFVEFSEPVADVHHFWQKMFLPLELSKYDRVIQMDADMLVKSDAPSPLDVCDHAKVGVVPDAQVKDCKRAQGLKKLRTRETALWSHISCLDDIPDEEHVNAGLIIYSPNQHADVFAEVRRIGQSFRWFHIGLPEQSVLSLVLAKSPGRRQLMGQEWNTVSILSAFRPRFTRGNMKTFIYHFNACRDQAKKNAAIASVNWE